jgi:acyl-coenzyme A synthetase/AMP-(fatty) acid ligase
VALTHLPIVALLGLQAGSAVVIPPLSLRNLAGMDAHRVASLGLIHDANVLLCSPFVAQRLGETALSTRISRLITGGSPVFPEDAAGLIRTFPNASGTAIYGATEAEPVSAAVLCQLAENQVDAMRGLWVGKAVTEVGVRIQGLGTGVPLPHPGQLGEIAVSGPHVLRRYLGQLERSPDAFHGMGDTGFLTPEGDLCLCGRVSQAVLAHGQPVSSLYWEHRLRQLPGVTGAALINDGGTAWAVVEAQSETETRSHLAHFHYFEDELAIPPARWRVVRALPRDKRHNGKVLYEAVIRKVSGH